MNWGTRLQRTEQRASPGHSGTAIGALRVGLTAIALAVLLLGAASGNTMTAVWTLPAPDDATDFHVVLNTSMTSAQAVEKGPFENFELVQQPDDVRVAKWSSIFMVGGVDVTVGLGFAGVESMKIKEAFWTANGSRLDQPKVNLPGFRKQEGGSVTYILTNDTDADMTISGLQFLLNEPAQRPIAALGWGRVPGPWTLPLGDFVLESGTEESFYLPTVADELWQLTQFAVDPTGSSPAWAMHEFNVIVPEPGTIVLLAAGLLGLVCYAWRRRR